MSTPLVIVGTGLAGYTLAREVRKLDPDREIVMVTADDGSSYSKPMLSTGFAKGKAADGLVMASAADMAAQLRLVVRTGTQVVALNARERILTLDTGEVIQAEAVVLATGASPIRLPVEQQAPERVFHINSLEDYRRFRDALPDSARVLIMGAGLIGCEFANDLLQGGHSPEVVAPCDAPLPGLLPTEAGRVLQAGLEAAGARFHLPAVVTRLTGHESGVTAELDTGVALKADAVISAVGLRPDLALAQAAGLAVNRGIVVDRYLRTSAEGIHALGDAAEIEGQVRLYVQPLMASARALARTLCGEPTAVTFGPMPVVVKTPACPVVVCPPEAPEGQWHLHASDDINHVCRFEDAQGQLKGFALVGPEAVMEKMALTRALTSG
ncbi:MAG: FAD-dependent oxidoreductase [Gammaproteobacteria bacterium]|nr:MAG: FAD-dependent oxidoreductase [Gammaproteobacteria bacterium]